MKMELIYLDLRARGETPRMILHHAGVKFVDTKVPWDDVSETKKKSPTGQFPILIIDQEDGTRETFVESGAIIRYVGRVSGLYPTDPLEQLKQDQLVEIVQSSTTCNPLMNFFDCESPSFQQTYDDYFSSTQPKLSLLGDVLAKRGTPFFGGTTPLIGDFHVWFLLDQMETLKPGTIAETPVLESFFKNLLIESKGLKDYLRGRPKAAEVGVPGQKNLGRTLGTNQYYLDLEN